MIHCKTDYNHKCKIKFLRHQPFFEQQKSVGFIIASDQQTS